MVGFSVNCPVAATLKNHQAKLIYANEQYQAIIPILKQEAVVTHGDIDQLCPAHKHVWLTAR